jgi:hypothetical protein
VVDAIKNGVREAGYDKPNQMQIIRSVAGAVASTDNRQQYTIHEFSLLRNGSNVSATDIGNALSSLYIDRPWDQMQAILNSVGVGAPIQDRFRTCGLKRNAAAHGGQPIEYSDLTEITDLAIPLCFAFDVIFSGGMSRIADNVPTNDGDPRIDVAGGATIRYVDKRGSRWCRLNQNKQPHRYFPTRAVTVQDSRRSLSANGVIVILGQAGEIIGWHLADQRHPHQ